MKYGLQGGLNSELQFTKTKKIFKPERSRFQEKPQTEFIYVIPSSPIQTQTGKRAKTLKPN